MIFKAGPINLNWLCFGHLLDESSGHNDIIDLQDHTNAFCGQCQRALRNQQRLHNVVV
jgi:hypothetical protein